MLLQKTGLRIKQLISHRRKSSIEDSGDSRQDRFTDRKLSLESSAETSKRASWLSQSPSSEFPPVRWASSIASRSRPSAPVNTTTHSSASSLCSCECAPILSPIHHSLSGAAPQRLEPRPEILYIPLPSPTPLPSDAKTWRLIFSEGVSQPPALVTTRLGSEMSSENSITRGSTFDLLEALAIIPTDKDSTPEQSIKNTENSDMDVVSENVEQLIRETDRAFQAVGNALADVRAATQGWYDMSITTPAIGALESSCDLFEKQPRLSSVPLESPISKTNSVTKRNGRTFFRKNTALLGKEPHNARPPAANTPSRWTLTDVTTNMADVFSGKMFRTEVDEMLTPSRIERLRDNTKSEKEGKSSLESTCSADTDGGAETEPCHLENLSSRISAEQRNQTDAAPFLGPVLPVPAASKVHFSGMKEEAVDVKPADMELIMAYKDLNFPSPPRVPGRSTPRCTLPLPTIPESSSLTLTLLQSFDASCQDPQISTGSNQQPQDYLLLPSTSFTLTLPLYRHGPIRLERKQEELRLEEEPLDWTAFQMAISGTMSEIDLDRRDDLECAADDAELDEIMEWWAGFGFQSMGSMMTDKSCRRWRRPEVTDINTCKRSGRGDVGTDKIVVEHDIQAAPIRWVKEDYAESLPPSPMLDLVLRSPSKDDEVIPMGFNLGHDLGDFLNWETKNVRKYFVDD